MPVHSNNIIKGTILLFEDQPGILSPIKKILLEADYNLIPSNNIEILTEITDQIQPDLILFDLYMPDAEVYNRCKTLKEKTSTRNIPLIILSGLNDHDIKVKVFKLGAVDFIVKPFAPEELLSRVKTHITSYQISGELLNKKNILEKEITERKKAETSLKSSNARLNLMNGITRHDILNNIRAMDGFVYFAKRDISDPAFLPVLEKMESIISIIQSQIEYTRFFQDLGSMSPEWISIDSILPKPELWENIRFIIETHDVQIFADTSIDKVFSYILKSWKESGKNPIKVRITDKIIHDKYILILESDGLKIKADAKEKMADGDLRTDEWFGSSRIKDILSLTKITIKETEHEGIYTGYEFHVPKDSYRLKSMHSSEMNIEFNREIDSPYPGIIYETDSKSDVIDTRINPPWKILIVDDTSSSIQVIRMILEKAGYQVMIAGSGESAIEKIILDPPDLVLMGVLIPGIDGYETCRRLKGLDNVKDIPVIFLSCLFGTIDKVKAFRSGAVDYMIKPIDPEELLARINTHLTINHLKRQVEQKNHELRCEILVRKEVESRLIKVQEELEEDVTSRTHELDDTNKKLIFRNILLKTQQETSLDGILVSGDEHRILSYNQQFLHIWQISPDILERESNNMIWMIRDKIEDLLLFDELVLYYSEHKSEKIRKEIKLKDNRYLDCYGAPMIGLNEKFCGRVWYFRDITKQKRIEREMKTAIFQIDKDLKILADLNDQIRNPLSIMSLLADDIETGKKERLLKEIERINCLVDMLDKGWIVSEKVMEFLRKHYVGYVQVDEL